MTHGIEPNIFHLKISVCTYIINYILQCYYIIMCDIYIIEMHGSMIGETF